ncbi:HAD-IA family hydrolase [Allobranchiibius huperziae]
MVLPKGSAGHSGRRSWAVTHLPGARIRSCPPRGGHRNLLDGCRNAGLTVVLATSGAKSDLDWMLPRIGAHDVVMGAITSDDVVASKPAPDLLTAALKEHRLDSARTAVVGDTVWDVEAAQRAGLPCIALLSGGIAEAKLRDAGAIEVYEDPADLLAKLESSLLRTLVRRVPRNTRR